MGQSTVYELPWPEPTDPADGPAAFQALALATEKALGAPLVTALPSSPDDGEMVAYRVSANGPVWRFVYMAGSTAPRWHFLGGAPLAATIAAEVQQSTQSAWGDLPGSVGPSVTLPLAGDYEIAWGAQVKQNQNGNALMSVDKFGVTWLAAQQAPSGSVNYPVSIGSQALMLGATTGVAKVQYLSSGGGAFYANRYLIVRPLRVS